jgi:cytochrome P450
MKIDITKFEDSCPLFVSSYRETIRLANGQMSTRRVMADTTINDGENTYLLRKGADIQIPAGVSHTDRASWGPNVSLFDPRRFMKLDEKRILSEKEKADEKEQRRAYFPFGGGKYLCPGRNFAFAEILGTVSLLLLGFELRTKDGGSIPRQPIGRPRLGTAIAQPSAQTISMGARLTRRKGWEDAVFKFVTGKE